MIIPAPSILGITDAQRSRGIVVVEGCGVVGREVLKAPQGRRAVAKAAAGMASPDEGRI
jgi:hypothetical protein